MLIRLITNQLLKLKQHLKVILRRMPCYVTSASCVSAPPRFPIGVHRQS